MSTMKNEYLDQVMQEQASVARELRAKKRPMASRSAGAPAPDTEASAGVDVRVTGMWRWKTVVVPPNCYVVHTRRGHRDPLHIGLGESFRYNPYLDSFLVVPAAMQTIVINARCVCKEKQGVLVQAYVQWMVDDFETAYKKLDFSDADDPMRVVNVQLREQAEAAIKDKVATMGVEDVLADKQPIIEELTWRLTEIARGKDSGGLGLKIVTVQIKEAVVSSPRVWESLQRPFRAEQSRIARLAEIENAEVVETRERLHEEAQRKAAHEAAQRAWDREQDEAQRRAAQELLATLEQERREVKAAEERVALEEERLKAEARALRAEAELEKVKAELARQRLTHELEMKSLQSAAHAARETQRLEVKAREQEIDNALTPARVEERLIEALPAIAERMPKPDKLIAVGDNVSSVAGLVAGVREVLGTPAKA